MTLTKSWLQKQITDLEATRDEIPFGLDEDGNNTLAAFKTALAGMEAVPVYNDFLPKNLDKALAVVGLAIPESREEFNFQQERWIQRLIDRVIRFADEFPPQPATVVPDDGRDQFEEWFKFHHGDEHSIVMLQRANGGANYIDPYVDLAWISWKDSRAGMLQGKAEPVSKPYKLPDGWVAVPVEMTPEQMRAVQLKSELGADAAANLSGAYSLFSEFWRVAISAAPQSGAVKDACEHEWVHHVPCLKPEYDQCSKCNVRREMFENCWVQSESQAGNSPVIQDGWVDCSERLPDETNDPDGGATCYLVLYAEGRQPNGGSNVQVSNVTYLRRWHDGMITHWMPLPAAPQQESE